jgi:hypothetical protein
VSPVAGLKRTMEALLNCKRDAVFKEKLKKALIQNRSDYRYSVRGAHTHRAGESDRQRDRQTISERGSVRERVRERDRTTETEGARARARGRQRARSTHHIWSAV